ncbi:hypothetical protein ASJ34_04450 [Xanthomonas campestris pv. campestris]|nr:hypothetical protein AEA01_06360 [Xanthomonas campestris pv. campestris]PJR21395.1 hypothetical protein ASJ34_04450 [Xanthomonas campestris pv. campestris]
MERPLHQASAAGEHCEKARRRQAAQHHATADVHARHPRATRAARSPGEAHRRTDLKRCVKRSAQLP